jgi:arsenate reductase
MSKESKVSMQKIKIAFICVHNSCRSQIAEALTKKFYFDFFEAYSAGTETKDKINSDAVRLMKKHYQIDMEKDQYSKLLSTLPPIDIVITMGCNVECPFIPSTFREDWGLDDPTGKSDEAFMDIIHQIEVKLLSLKNRIIENQINLQKKVKINS